MSSKLETLQDNFNDNILDTEKWEVYSSKGGQANERSGRLELTVPPWDSELPLASIDVVSKEVYNLRNSYAYVRFSAHMGDSSTWFYIEGIGDGNGWTVFERFFGGIVGYWASEDFSSTYETFSDSYDPTLHRWLRFRQVSSVVYFDISPDGLHWTNVGATEVAFDDTVKVGFYMAGNSSSLRSRTSLIDNFNILPAKTNPMPGNRERG